MKHWSKPLTAFAASAFVLSATIPGDSATAREMDNDAGG